MTAFIAPSVRQVIAAKRAFIGEGRKPGELVDAAILRSWERCVSAARQEQESVVFEAVGRAVLGDLLERNRLLLRAANGPLHDLAKAVSGAGYAVLLTDADGYALSVLGEFDGRAPAMKSAFRPGVDLSERTIGTSAMSCALSERRAVRVFGPEHYFAATHLFHCAAAPILMPDGKLAGVVDITRDTPKPDFGALSLVTQCARAIERELFGEVPAFLTMELSWELSPASHRQELILAFSEAGEVIGLNERARRFVGPDLVGETLRYEDVFEDRFADRVDALRRLDHPVPIRLRSGLSLFATGRRFVSTPASPAPSSPAVRGEADETHPPAEATLPEFGDPAIGRAIERAGRATSNGLPVLILGETGTGKEIVAQLLHARSERASGPFIAINCAAIPENLIEGELFGHVDGAFTGARRGGAKGRIESADGGTLFLDEIGDMPFALQARLLRVLETREISRLGSSVSRNVDFRLICATHQNLEAAVGEGRFRADLFYRIKGYPIELSPLRTRPDLQALVNAVLASVSDGSRVLSQEALAYLLQHDWPGNVRELRHALVFAHVTANPGEVLRPADFPPLPSAGAKSGPRPDGQGDEENGLLRRIEEEAIQQALQACSGRVADAAKRLGMGRATLYRRLQRMARNGAPRRSGF